MSELFLPMVHQNKSKFSSFSPVFDLVFSVADASVQIQIPTDINTIEIYSLIEYCFFSNMIPRSIFAIREPYEGIECKKNLDHFETLKSTTY